MGRAGVVGAALGLLFAVSSAVSAGAAEDGPSVAPAVVEPQAEAAPAAPPVVAARGGVRFIPVPEIVVSPNEGETVGALGVFLFSDENKQIRRIVAPDVRYNKIFGVYPTFRLFEYPDSRQKVFVSAGKSTDIDEKYEATYNGKNLWRGRLDLDARFMYEHDSRERFFGIGNGSDENDESNYTGEALVGKVAMGLHLPDDLILQVGLRFRRVRVRRGGVDELPFTGDLFPDVGGLGGKSVVGPSFGLFYDTRDLPDAPSQGSLVGARVEIIDKALGSSTSFLRYSLDGRTFRPLRPDGKILLAMHLAADYMQGGERAPFYELSSLGGVESLRGFGSHRFRDRHRIFLQAEVRSQVYARDLFGVRGVLEVAPFVEAGKVFDDSRESVFTGLHPVGGLGVRAVVKPQVVAYVDFGVGEEGPAVFTGIDYPF